MTEIKTTPLDHLPPDFNLDELKKTLTEQEIAAMTGGDDPIFGAAAPAPEPEATPAASMAQAAPAPVPVMPVLPEVPDTTAAKATVDGFDAQIDALDKRYQDGEIDMAEMRAAMKALTLEQAQAQALIQQAQAFEKVRTDTQVAHQATVEQQWNGALEAYKAQNSVLWQPEHVAGWDAALRAVTGGPLGETLTMEQCIAKAHEVYRMNYTATTGKVLGAPKVSADGTEIPDKPRTDPREPLQTLAGVNGEAATAMTDGTFAVVDRMILADPDKAEALFASMSKAQQAKYLETA